MDTLRRHQAAGFLIRRRGWAALPAVIALVSTLMFLPAPAAAAPEHPTAVAVAPRPAPGELKMMNYYPSTAGWSAMWTSYSHARTDKDFAAIAGLGANTVRIIVQPAGVGWPVVSEEGAAALADVVATAAGHGLGVQLTLFDLWYSWSDVATSKAWATDLLGPYRDDQRIVLVELQNEIPTANEPAMDWARQMLPHLAALLPGVPRSLSAFTTASLRAIGTSIPRESLDVIDVHLFGTVQTMPARLAAAQQVADGRPVIVGEAGDSTGRSNTPGSEQAQLSFYEKVTQLVHDTGIGTFAPWILSDFTSGAMPASLASSVEAAFGLRRLNGSWKPAATAVRNMFQHKGNVTFTPDELAAGKINGDFGFEKENARVSPGAQLGAWSSYATAQNSLIGTQAVNGAQGRLSAVLGRTGGTATAVPALYQTFLLLSGKRTVTVAATMRLVDATGFSRVSIAWFDGYDYLGSTEGPNADNAVTAWQPTSVTGTAPERATSFQIHLKSANNTGRVNFDALTLS